MTFILSWLNRFSVMDDCRTSVTIRSCLLMELVAVTWFRENWETVGLWRRAPLWQSMKTTGIRWAKPFKTCMCCNASLKILGQHNSWIAGSSATKSRLKLWNSEAQVFCDWYSILRSDVKIYRNFFKNQTVQNLATTNFSFRSCLGKKNFQNADVGHNFRIWVEFQVLHRPVCFM